jgi:putative oxidoreductase
MSAGVIALVARALLAFLFVMAGVAKLADIAGTAGYFESLGMPMATAVAWASGLFELGAGLLVLAGFATRIASAALATFCIVAGYLGHYGQGGDDAMLALMHSQAFMKDIGLAGGFALLSLHGPGPLSIDARLR